jgi:hypothetical protein
MTAKASEDTGDWFTEGDAYKGSNRPALNSAAATNPNSSNLSYTTATSFTVGALLNDSGVQYTAYLFAENQGNGITGGNYIGTGVALKVATGFDTQFVLVRNITSGGNWVILDSVRSAANPALDQINPNLQDVESVVASGVDFLVDGFELQGAEPTLNAIGDDYIYLAIADPTTL